MTQRIPPDKHPTNHHGYEYQQGSLWGDQETKAIQQAEAAEQQALTSTGNSTE